MNTRHPLLSCQFLPFPTDRTAGPTVYTLCIHYSPQTAQRGLCAYTAIYYIGKRSDRKLCMYVVIQLGLTSLHKSSYG